MELAERVQCSGAQIPVPERAGTASSRQLLLRLGVGFLRVEVARPSAPEMGREARLVGELALPAWVWSGRRSGRRGDTEE